MFKPRLALPALLLALVAVQPVIAIPVSQKLQHWECVPVARSLSGIQIRGDAHTWWGQAAGRYKRGNEPKRGAVLAFKPYGAMELGHVAAVSRVIDDRNILVTHSNWSPINGRRGQIEQNVRVVDVSDQNDWSRVRVWFAPTQDLGTTAWPTHGFIYPEGKAPMRLPDSATPAPAAPQLARPKAEPPMAVAREGKVPRLGYANVIYTRPGTSRAVAKAPVRLVSSVAAKTGSGLSGLAASLDKAASAELKAHKHR
jgi:surface antigen